MPGMRMGNSAQILQGAGWGGGRGWEEKKQMSSIFLHAHTFHCLFFEWGCNSHECRDRRS